MKQVLPALLRRALLHLPNRSASLLASGVALCRHFGWFKFVGWVSLLIGMAATSASVHGQSAVLDSALVWLWHSAPLLQIA